uniref:Uncharacterized protein n=1 Tax=Callorhinchus milii TaxID=7868 RepID=A0A4W3I2Q7_CALMI
VSVDGGRIPTKIYPPTPTPPPTHPTLPPQENGGYDSKSVAGISLDGCICLPQGEGIHQIREALKILAERVLILETMIGIHEPEHGSGLGPYATPPPNFFRGKRGSFSAYRIISHRLAAHKAEEK